MSTNSSPAEQSNETKLPNQINILKILQSIFIPSAMFSTIVKYFTNKSASSFYGINSELFHSQSFWSTLIDFFAPALVNLAILLTPFIVAVCYRNSLKSVKKDSDSKGKTLKLPNLLHLIFISFYSLLSSCYVLYQYAVLYDSINKGCIFIIICTLLLLFILEWLIVTMNTMINTAQQAGKDTKWYPSLYFLYFLLIIILLLFLLHFMGIHLLVLLILYNFFTVYYLATLYYFLDENKLFSYTSNVCFIILALCIIIIPLYSGRTYYSGKKQYEIVEPISSSNIASGSNLKVVILHKNNQLLLMDFRISTDENTKDGSAPPQENETQAKQSIEEILSKASESNLNIKKGEYTIQDENLYKFYTVTFKKVECE